MAGSLIKCGVFEGQDKSGSPAVAVLSEAYRRSFGREPRGRIVLKFSAFTGGKRAGIEGAAEAAILSVKYDETANITPDVCAHLLPSLKEYQKEVLGRLGISDTVEEIWPRVTKSTRAKYGSVRDDGWRAYCLHDLVIAFEKSAKDTTPVQIVW
jgi:hypothetical protein